MTERKLPTENAEEKEQEPLALEYDNPQRHSKSVWLVASSPGAEEMARYYHNWQHPPYEKPVLPADWSWGEIEPQEGLDPDPIQYVPLKTYKIVEEAFHQTLQDNRVLAWTTALFFCWAVVATAALIF